MIQGTGIRRVWPAVIMVGLLLAPRASLAQDRAGGNSGAVSFQLGVDWTSAYFFRGLLQENAGEILQPSAEVGFALIEGDRVSLSASLGTWNSFHSERTGANATDSFVRSWYESDVYAGLEAGIGAWTLGTQFITYAYPNGAASSIDEVALSLAWDDSSLWPDGFALNPWVLYAVETRDRGGPENSYFEAGLSLSHTWDVSERSAVSIDVPFVVGASVKDYYVTSAGKEDTIGYMDVGLNVGYGIPIPVRFGGWSLSAGLHYLSLGDAARELNGGDGSAFIGRIGLSLSY